MLPVAILSVAALVVGSPLSPYADALDKRQGVGTTDFGNFKFYSQHAAAAYCNSEDTRPGDSVACSGECDDVQRNGASIIDIFSGSRTGIAGYASVDDARREIVVSIRGSNNIRNFITDIIFKMKDCSLTRGCKVHTGFADAWDEIAHTATSAIHEGLTANPSYKVVITGHSLGGAVAHLGAAYLRQAGYACDVYTYGSPRVGNDKFANFATSQPGKMFRVTHEADPVPRLPPIIFGYRHTSPEYWLTSRGSSSIDYLPGDIRICNGIANILCNAGTFGLDIIAHLHYMGDTTGCAPFPLRWKRDDPSDEELKQRLNDWSQQDQDLVNNGNA
ncbi:hypothetical protein K4F52_005584 [Lecanicillium sp. MT-2017a]|nr:hypothetical protein K4F52_005584 [Lecanicillium sp. MT-2017a]